MRTDENIFDINLCDSVATHELKTLPSIAGIFAKAICLSFIRSNRFKKNLKMEKHCLKSNAFRPDPEIVEKYCRVCGFDKHLGILPVSFIQPMFIKLLGKYITSSFFPFKPIGLIQIYQSFEWHRPVRLEEALDLSCELEQIQTAPKGFLTDFLLTARVADEIVWQGTARYLLKMKTQRAAAKKKKEDKQLKEQETIIVPADIGRQYAAASGDYNFHHLYPFLARMFGFKSAIAHGMWSMARCIASLDRAFDIRAKGRVEVSFKLPIFLPAVTALYFDNPGSEDKSVQTVNFRLKDDQKKRPHLEGRLYIKT